jgi:tetratricopeptide (TPR) repeat protein
MSKRNRLHRSAAAAVKISPTTSPRSTSPRMRLLRYGIYAALIVGAIALRYWLKGPDVPLPPPEGLDSRLVEQIENARAAIWQAPGKPEKWGQLGMLLAAHSFTNEALQCFDRAEELDPGSWRWPYLRSIALERSDTAQARDALRSAAVVAGADDPMPRLLLAERLLEIGETDEAQRHLQFALHEWPSDPRANLDYARLQFATGEVAQTIEPLQKAAKDRHTRKAAHQLLAQIEQRLGHDDAANQALATVKSIPGDEVWPDPWREALESFRTTKGAYIARINELGRRGDYARLNRVVAQSIEAYPELAHLVAGRERLSRGDLTGAEAALRRALELDPKSIDALLSLGDALEQHKNLAQAEDSFRRAVAVEPTNGDAHLRLGRCLAEQKEFDAALAPLQSAVQFMPSSVDAHDALADAFSALGHAVEAADHRRQAARLRGTPTVK